MYFRSLLPAVALLAMAPAASLAQPVQCIDVCTEATLCSRACGEGAWITTCGESGLYPCFDPTLSDGEPTASVAMEESSLVCSEAHQDAEQAETAEG